MFGHRFGRLLPLPQFLSRLARHLAVTGSILTLALSIGIVGYRYVAHLAWIDALLEASMILAGMGPVSQLESSGAKIFASSYALFSGVVFLTSVGVLFSPIFHRLLHKFHIDEQDAPDEALSKR